jgi:phage I-like protein
MKERVELLFAAELPSPVEGVEPPTELRLLAAGQTATTKGPIVMNAAAGGRVLAAMTELGRDLLNFDYGHAQLSPLQSYESARSAGWYRVEVRGDELWLADIRWTPLALQALRDREFRYLSPALFRDSKTGEIISLINVALTNLPATKHQTPLVASDVGDKMSEKWEQERAELLAASQATNAEVLRLRAEIDARDAAASAAAKQTLLDQMQSDGRLPPALRSWAEKQSLVAVQEYAAAATPHAAARRVEPAAQVPGSGSAATAAKYAPEAISIFRQFGLTPKDVESIENHLKRGPSPLVCLADEIKENAWQL